MATAPPLTLPLEGEPIDADVEFAFVKASSALYQAKFWNTILRADPVFGPTSGYVVGVGPRMDGRYPLVWLRPPAGGPDVFEDLVVS